jgi:hypothetical protein
MSSARAATRAPDEGVVLLRKQEFQQAQSMRGDIDA